ncbi:DUF1697 domain-containing protein [Lacrimispora defluvii]|uniref:DUF1697 domain-containing protein n=1 Tax=Lacrimispora defluvii TaxID=2719233 RepID=A0ABX1VLQ4_9FIRM|nr:DUF1697 domain-containing protein [Lacrimispora defluvii]NNJ29292.1 DUF1697 domain-containing protein [Lacrimispora defluvii]
MQKYIALLRGINVGGKNKISMPELKKMFEACGYGDVITYINSGNVIFSSEQEDKEEIKKICESAIASQFSLNIIVTVISAKDLSAALCNAPAWWDHDEQSKHNAIFVIPPATAEEIIHEVGIAKEEYEQVSYYGQVIFWSAPIKTFSKTRWSKIVGKSAYNSVTIRNANTAKKLLQLSGM